LNLDGYRFIHNDDIVVQVIKKKKDSIERAFESAIHRDLDIPDTVTGYVRKIPDSISVLQLGDKVILDIRGSLKIFDTDLYVVKLNNIVFKGEQ